MSFQVVVLENKRRVKWKPVHKAIESMMHEAQKMDALAKAAVLANNDTLALMYRYKGMAMQEAVDKMAQAMPRELRAYYKN